MHQAPCEFDHAGNPSAEIPCLGWLPREKIEMGQSLDSADVGQDYAVRVVNVITGSPVQPPVHPYAQPVFRWPAAETVHAIPADVSIMGAGRWDSPCLCAPIPRCPTW